MSSTLSRQEAVEKFKKYIADDETFREFKYLRQDMSGDWHAFVNKPAFDGVHWKDAACGNVLPVSGPKAYNCELLGWDFDDDETSLEEAKKQAIDILVKLFGARGCVIVPDGTRETSVTHPYYDEKIRRCGGCGVFFYKGTDTAEGFEEFAYTLDSGITWIHSNIYMLSAELLRFQIT